MCMCACVALTDWGGAVYDFKTFFKKFKRMFFQLSQNVEAKAEAAPGS